MRIDEFFEKQPTPRFIEDLSAPLHEKAPDGFSLRAPEEGEIFAGGAYINERFPDGEGLLDTAYEDFTRFLSVTGSLGTRYPISFRASDALPSDSYTITVNERECTVFASDVEACRRAVFYLEEEFVKREGAVLPIGSVTRRAKIKDRITRGFFSPTNRAPKWGDELFDDVDYYPDEYLNRLAHNGTNGLWIYTSFAQLIKSPYVPSSVEGCERRMQKLSEVVKKCRRYGVKVYIFAIEPMGLTEDECEPCLDMLGADATSSFPKPRRPFCPRIDKTREHIIYCLENIFKSIPGLAGYISITAGERPTTCASVGTYKTCPRCGKFSRGENLAYSVNVIKEGLRRAGTGAEFISWTYGHRYWDDNDILEYIDKTDKDIVIMQNYEDRGTDIQLGKPRIAWDYWLSYPGPSDMFSLSARRATETGHRAYAKMQVCTSHEMATVPYIPAPGILFGKYGDARALGVEGIMECWYFGNYPSLMNRASTELSYVDDFDNKEEFLVELAARMYGRTKAPAVAKAWECFEESYRNYPTNIMFSYYGPMHDGVVWELFPIPKNRALPRSWLLLDPPDGDRIGECLFKGHTLKEALILTSRMKDAWHRGLKHLPFDESNEHATCARAIGLLIDSGNNILEFYRLRAALGDGSEDALAALGRMEEITREEISNSREMSKLCELDSRLGYHSEAEGFKFFPEKLISRCEKLEELFSTDFEVIKKRIAEKKSPLGYYTAEGEDYYPLGCDPDGARWEQIEEGRAFSVYRDGDSMKINVRCKPQDKLSVCFEYSLFNPECVVVYSGNGGGAVHGEVVERAAAGLTLGANVLSHQSVYGEGIYEELSNYSITSSISEELAEHTFTAKIPEGKWNGKSAIKLAIRIGGKPWKYDNDPIRTLGKADLSPDDFGFLLPISK